MGRGDNDIVELRPTAMAAGGDAIGRDDDGARCVSSPGRSPKSWSASPSHRPRRDTRGRVVDVVEASSDRVEAECVEVGKGCGGCQWQHIAIPRQRQLKRDIVADALRRIGHIDDAPIAPSIELPADGYRTSIRAAVVGDRAGYRPTRGHDVMAVDSCLIAHPLVADLLVNGRYEGADEVVLRCGARTGERLAAPAPSRAAIVVPDDVRPDHFHEEAAGRRWRISARSFFQSRPDGADALAALVAAAADAVGPPGRAVDLYSGVGLFAGVLAAKGWSVTAVEGSAAAVADAEVNLEADAVRVVTPRRPAVEGVTRPIRRRRPSRNGLARQGVDVVASTKATRVVLISCDPASLGRDAALLSEAGYRLQSVTPIDMFPHTFHVETVLIFDR